MRFVQFLFFKHALGILCAVFFLWFTFQLCPRVLRTTLNFISRIVHKGKEARAE